MGRKRFLLPVTYFSTNLVYPFTLRLTGINICETLPSVCYILFDESSIPFYSTSESSIPFYSTSNGYNKEEHYSQVPRLSDIRYDYQIPVSQLKGHYQIPVTQLKWPQREMEICKQQSDLNAPPTSGRQIYALCSLKWAWQTFFWC